MVHKWLPKSEEKYLSAGHRNSYCCCSEASGECLVSAITPSWAWCSQFLVRLAASEPQRSSHLHPYSAGVTGMHETMPSLLTWVLGFQLGSSCLGSHPPPQPLTNTFEENSSYVCVNCYWLWVIWWLLIWGLGFALLTFDVLYWGYMILLFLLYLH